MPLGPPADLPSPAAALLDAAAAVDAAGAAAGEPRLREALRERRLARRVSLVAPAAGAGQGAGVEVDEDETQLVGERTVRREMRPAEEGADGKRPAVLGVPVLVREQVAFIRGLAADLVARPGLHEGCGGS